MIVDDLKSDLFLILFLTDDQVTAAANHSCINAHVITAMSGILTPMLNANSRMLICAKMKKASVVEMTSVSECHM